MHDFYPIVVAVAFNATDIVSGIVAGLKERQIKSSKLRDGLFKKCGFLLCYALAFMIDHYGALIGFNFAVALIPAVVLYACTTEVVSIIENIGRINPELLPEKLLVLFHMDGKEK